MRHDRYIGYNHLWIRWYNGTHEVRSCEDDHSEDPEIITVFKGRYEDCVKYINDQEIAYLESLY